jgi:hypothetical protein
MPASLLSTSTSGSPSQSCFSRLSLRETLQLAHDLVVVASARLLAVIVLARIIVLGGNTLVDAVLVIDHPLEEDVPTEFSVLVFSHTCQISEEKKTHLISCSSRSSPYNWQSE